MIHVLATVQLTAGRRSEFLREFAALVPLVRAEQGCLEYGAAIDLPTQLPPQIPLRPDVVTVVEKWVDLPALEAHLVAPHMHEYRGRVKHLVQSTQLQILEPA